MGPKGFPLAAMFVVVVLFATLMALGGPTARQFQDGIGDAANLQMTIGGLALTGAVVGGFVGICHYRIWRGIGHGIVTGMVVGCATAPATMSANLVYSSAILIGGSVLMLLIAVIYRLQ